MRGFVLLAGVVLLALAGSATAFESAPAPLELKPRDTVPRVHLDVAPPVVAPAKLEAPKRFLEVAAPGSLLNAAEPAVVAIAPSAPRPDVGRAREVRRRVRAHPCRAGP